MVGCCARAASGQATAAAPPSNVMNSRRFIIRSPRRRARAGCRRFETERLRGFEVDNELDLRDLLHRQLGRMLPFALRMRPVETPTKRLPPVRATVAMVTCP